MANKTVAVNIDVNAKSLNDLEGDLKGINKQIDQIEESSSKMTVDQKFKGAAGSIKAFAGAVEAAVGATILLGVESKVFEEYERYALGALSFGRGIFDLTEGINDMRESTLLANAATKAQDILNKVTAVSARALGIATNTASTAFKGLKAAIAATGIGLLVVAIGFVIEKLMMMADATDAANAAQKKFNDSIQENVNLLNEQNTAINNTLEQELLRAELAGEAEGELENKRLIAHGDRMLRFDEAEARAKDALTEAKKYGEEEVAAAEKALQQIRDARDNDDRSETNRRLKRSIAIKKQAATDAKAKLEADKKYAKDKAALETKLREETATTQEEFEFNQLDKVSDYYEKLIDEAEKYGFDTTKLELKRQEVLSKLFTEFDNKEFIRQDAYLTEVNSLILASNEAYTDYLIQTGEARAKILESQQYNERERLKEDEDIALEDLRLRFDQELITYVEYLELKEQTENVFTNRSLALKEKQLNQTKELADQEKIIALELNQYKVGLYAQAAGDIAATAAALFEDNKQVAMAAVAIEAAASIAGVVANTAVANARALAELGPVVGAGVVVAQKIAAGASIIAIGIQKGIAIDKISKASKNSSPSTSGGSVSGLGSGGASISRSSSLNQQGPIAQPEASSACMRTYVLAGDVTSDQEANAKLSRKRNIA
jgi:hypothetical protein